MYFLLPIQILVLLLSPRFGWNIHNDDSTLLRYANTSHINGDFHSQYISNENTIDICYKNPLSKQFFITVNNADVYYMEVGLDGNIINYDPKLLQFTSNDIVWKDSSSIFYWRYILTIVLTLFSIRLFHRAKCIDGKKSNKIYICSMIIYVISILISLRFIL